MSERDPRVDPKVGDVLTRNSLSRRVVAVDGFDVRWQHRSDTQIRTCWITTWREWARMAEVVERGAP